MFKLKTEIGFTEAGIASPDDESIFRIMIDSPNFIQDVMQTMPVSKRADRDCIKFGHEMQ